VRHPRSNSRSLNSCLISEAWCTRKRLLKVNPSTSLRPLKCQNIHLHLQCKIKIERPFNLTISRSNSRSSTYKLRSVSRNSSLRRDSLPLQLQQPFKLDQCQTSQSMQKKLQSHSVRLKSHSQLDSNSRVIRGVRITKKTWRVG
jgi:hypothetical protein